MQKNAMERGNKKCLTFVKLQIASKILGKIILKPFVISKRLKFPARMTEQVQILWHRLECISRDLRVYSGGPK